MVVDPLKGLVDGLLQGHALGQQIKQQQMQEQAFKTNQALQEQQMSIQDIMNAQRDQEIGRPVVNGTVQDKMNLDLPSTQANPQGPPDFNNLPTQGVAVPGQQISYARKADPSRTVSWKDRFGNTHSTELFPQEEIQQRAIDQQVKTSNALEMAKAQAQQHLLENQRTLRGVPVPPEFASAFPAGTTRVLPEEINHLQQQANAATEEQQKIQKGYERTTEPGKSIVTTAPLVPGGPQTAPRVVVKGEEKETPDKHNVDELTWRAANGTPEEQQQAKAALRSRNQYVQGNHITVNVPGMPGMTPKGGESPEDAKLTGDAYLAKLPPPFAAQVRAIAMGDATMPNIPSRATPNSPAVQIREAVFHYDPKFNNRRAQVLKAFTSDKEGQNVGALNTAVGHLAQMMEAATAMKNGTWQAGNDLYNRIAEQFGATAPTNYRFVMNALGGEAANALKGNATDPEISHILASIKPDLTEDQAVGVGTTGMHVLGVKLGTYNTRVQREAPGHPWNAIYPETQQIFRKYGVQSSSPGGQTPKFNVGDTVTYNGQPHKIKAIKADGKLVLEQ